MTHCSTVFIVINVYTFGGWKVPDMCIGITCNFAVDTGTNSNHFKNPVYLHYRII